MQPEPTTRAHRQVPTNQPVSARQRPTAPTFSDAWVGFALHASELRLSVSKTLLYLHLRWPSPRTSASSFSRRRRARATSPSATPWVARAPISPRCAPTAFFVGCSGRRRAALARGGRAQVVVGSYHYFMVDTDTQCRPETSETSESHRGQACILLQQLSCSELCWVNTYLRRRPTRAQCREPRPRQSRGEALSSATPP